MDSPWIAYHKLNHNAKIRLFCIPYAGAGASVFRTWAENLSDFIDICPIQLPGRENRFTESPIYQLDAIVEGLISALHPLLNLPIAFFGHSMGALVSFELARSLSSLNLASPHYLFVSGCHAPQTPWSLKHIHDLPTKLLIKELRRFNGTSEEVLQNEELIELLLPLFRADLSVFETYYYKPRPPLSFPISAFGGTNDSRVSKNDLLDWKSQTTEGFTLRMLLGDHFFLSGSQRELLAGIEYDLKEFVIDKNTDQ